MHSYLASTYNQLYIDFTHGNGAYLFDSRNNKYLDFLSGISVTNFGHNNDTLMNSAKIQIDSFWHTSNIFNSVEQEKLAKKLCDISGLNHVFFSNSGTEANEAAIKFVRKQSREKYKIITITNGFHGRSLGSLSATGQPKLKSEFGPMLDGFIHCEFNSSADIEKSIDEYTCAIMVEPILGEAGIKIPYDGYLKDLRSLCVKHDLFLIIDEVQTGLGRTGKHFAYQWENIQPDVVTLAKGIANGLPLGATLISSQINSNIQPGDHGSTFGGNPVAISVAKSVLELLTDEQLFHINKIGEYLYEKLKMLPNIKSIRKKGLMLGIDFKEANVAKVVCKDLFNHHVLAGTSGDETLRLLPPFIIDETEVDAFIKIFEKVLYGLKEKEVEHV